MPGMDMIRVNGDISFMNYWRGYRSSFNSPYLLMLDGISWCDLYYNDAEVMRAFPISNIERVEIVYGPASSIYGANAFNGVINVITLKEKDLDGSYLTATLSGGSRDKVIGDVNFFLQKNKLKFSVTARMENGDAFPVNNDSYEWSKSKYITDRRLWGGFVDSPASAGLKSLDRHRALDVRLYTGNIELAVIYYHLLSGYGVQYAVDKVMPNVIWSKTDYTAYGRYLHTFNEHLFSSTLLRYNGSDIPNDAALAQGYNTTNETGGTERQINFELWQSLNSSWAFSQDFQWTVKDNLLFRSGIEYEQKNLQKAYKRSAGPFLPPGSVKADTYPFPEPPVAGRQYRNRIITQEAGIYIHTKYAANKKNIFHLGARYDYNSQYGGIATFRTGYVRKSGKFVFKFLYGQAFQEPSPRVLYGAWEGLGSDPDLKPEESRTLEFSTSYMNHQTSHLFSLYLVNNSNTILNLQEGARNIGKRKIVGFDYHFKFHPQKAPLDTFHFWGYYSYTHTRGDEVYIPETNSYGKDAIGDIAPHKIYIGVTAEISPRFTVTLLGRHISRRKTVATNPIGTVDAYTLLDLNILIKNIFAEGLNISFKVNNLFNSHYFHPGIRTANSGNQPGFFDNDGIWQGSAGWLNSLLPQVKRTFLLSMTLEL